MAKLLNKNINGGLANSITKFGKEMEAVITNALSGFCNDLENDLGVEHKKFEDIWNSTYAETTGITLGNGKIIKPEKKIIKPEKKIINQKIEKKSQALVPSKLQTKDWRKAQDWYKGGRSTECEIYQRDKVQNIVGYTIPKNTGMRLNSETNTFEYFKQPCKFDNGFEYTEDFDGELFTEEYDCDYYFNFKMRIGEGGGQKTGLKDVYHHFITSQLNYLLADESNFKFVNILDGDNSFKVMNHYEYLINKEKYASITDRIYIGDLYDFENWWNQLSNK